MGYEVVKNKTEDETIKVNYCNNNLTDTDSIEEQHFGLPIQKKNYPSCYQYNVLIMLAKRLIKEEKQSADTFANRLHLDRKFANRIFNFEE